MKPSQFNVPVTIDDSTHLLFNTLTKKYAILSPSQKQSIEDLLSTFGQRDGYSQEEANLLKQLAQRGMLVADQIDELALIRKYQQMVHEQQDKAIIVIKMSLNCNFRCVYCYQEHTGPIMTEETEEQLIATFEKLTEKHNDFLICWFGGEPTIHLDQMERLTQKMQSISKTKNCGYHATITTNGYLVSPEVAKKLKAMGVIQAQVTVDGTAPFHNQLRPHVSGKTSYYEVIGACRAFLAEEIHLIFRVNVNDDNIHSIEDLLEEIPADYRSNVSISIASWFQAEEKLNCYSIFKRGIELGYNYSNKPNRYRVCEGDNQTTLSILPDGHVSYCSNIITTHNCTGILTNSGDILRTEDQLKLFEEYNKATALNNPLCQACVELPMCMGGCKKARYTHPEHCVGVGPDGLTLQDKIKLYYFTDLKNGESEAYRL